MLREEPPRLRLAHLPTPLEEMPNLTLRLKGPCLLIKRDDQTGLATGGNKTRKLEYIMADALAQGADTIVTLGASQSNHARQTAAAAAKLGLGAVLLLRGEEPLQRTGNLLLDSLLGAEVRWLGDTHPGKFDVEPIMEELRERGLKPYLVPYGASNEIGVWGYIQAMKELLEQLEDTGQKADYIVLATSSGGTQVGLTLGARFYGYEGKIIGISVDLSKEELLRNLVSLAQATATRWGFDLSLGMDDFTVYDDYLGGGYGLLGPKEIEAITLLARTEGILLDPVYTGRAMAGLIDLIRRGTFRSSEIVIFWHTGGTPALFAYAQELSSRPPRTGR